MSRHRFTIEFERDDQRHRVVYTGGANGVQWTRRHEIRKDDTWQVQSQDQISVPTFKAAPVGTTTFAGP